MSDSYAGLMFIGDPHLESRIPGFRCDDYPRVALKKFAWCLETAKKLKLRPILLGDLFHLPQDNPNWLVSQIIDTIAKYHGDGLLAIHGNHDIRENTRKPNDSISILFASGHLRSLSVDDPWVGDVAGKRVMVGGTDWSTRKLPKDDAVQKAIDRVGESAPDLVAWVTLHDILIPGYEEAGNIRPSDILGIDVIVNGHVHRRLDPVTKGGTHWITAGNITRRARSDASRSHIPAVPCLVPINDLTVVGDQSIESFAFDSRRSDRWDIRWMRVPHQPFDEVFHPEVAGDESDEEAEQRSGFISDLRELTARRTDTGAGLMQYLNQNVGQFDDAVAAEIMRLAGEVTSDNEND